MTPAGVKYVSINDSYRSQVFQCMTQVFQCMTPEGVKYIIMYDYCRSQVYTCMTPAGVKYFNV